MRGLEARVPHFILFFLPSFFYILPCATSAIILYIRAQCLRISRSRARARLIIRKEQPATAGRRRRLLYKKIYPTYKVFIGERGQRVDSCRGPC